MPATPVDPFSDIPAYRQVFNDLSRRLAAGEFPGRIPAERDLAHDYATSGKTIRHAIRLLRDAGLVKTASTRGTYNAGYNPADATDSDGI